MSLANMANTIHRKKINQFLTYKLTVSNNVINYTKVYLKNRKQIGRYPVNIMLLMVVILLTYLFLGWIPLFQAFGQTFITDDYFLAVVGSLAAVCNGAGRIMWGALADRYCFKVGTSKTTYFMNNKSLFKMVGLLHGIVSNRVGAR